MPSDIRLTGLPVTADSFRSAADRLSLSSSAAETVFVDLSEQAVTSNIVREGFQVPVATFDPNRFNDWIVNLPLPPKQDLPRVVQQSIPANQKVPPGTVVDLRLERPNTIPIDIFPGVHADLQGELVGTIAGSVLFENIGVRNSILKYSSAAEVPASDRGAIIEALGRISVAVDDAVPGKTFERAFNTLRNVAAFR